MCTYIIIYIQNTSRECDEHFIGIELLWSGRCVCVIFFTRTHAHSHSQCYSNHINKPKKKMYTCKYIDIYDYVYRVYGKPMKILSNENILLLLDMYTVYQVSSDHALPLKFVVIGYQKLLFNVSQCHQYSNINEKKYLKNRILTSHAIIRGKFLSSEFVFLQRSEC